jgi:hypothetical protein
MQPGAVVTTDFFTRLSTIRSTRSDAAANALSDSRQGAQPFLALNLLMVPVDLLTDVAAIPWAGRKVKHVGAGSRPEPLRRTATWARPGGSICGSEGLLTKAALGGDVLVLTPDGTGDGHRLKHNQRRWGHVMPSDG